MVFLIQRENYRLFLVEITEGSSLFRAIRTTTRVKFRLNSL